MISKWKKFIGLTDDAGALITDSNRLPVVSKVVDDSGVDISHSNPFHVQIPSTVSTNNSTTSTLGIGGIFTGTSDTINGDGIIYINVFSDQASATDGLEIQQSSDGINWDHSDCFTIPASSGKNYSINPYAKYFRIKYTNGAIAQTAFRLQVIFKSTGKPSSHRIQDSIIDDDDGELVKAVITGKNPSGTFVNFGATTAGNFKCSLEELENSVSVNSNTQLKTTGYDSGGTEGSYVEFRDSYNLDAFGRLRTSNTGQRLDVEFIYDKQPDFFDEITNNGTVTHNANTRDLTLSISDANNGTYATMRSHPVPYTPGNSQLIDITGVLDLANIGSGTAETFIRTKISGSVVETATAQSSWDNATSGVDWADSHILSMDFQSLKVGRIKFYLIQNGLPVKLTEICNDNVRNSGYWQLPSLPVYWRLHNDATYTYMEMGYGDEDNAIGIRYKITANASATMKAICATVKSEGGDDLKDIVGLPRTIDNNTTAVTVSTTLIPILSIRMRSTFNSLDNLSIALPRGVTVQTDEDIKYVLLHDNTLTNASWVSVDADDSVMEYDISATATSGGHQAYSDYVSGSGGPQTPATFAQGILGKTVLWDRQSSRTGIFTIAAIKTATNDASVFTAIRWEEIR